MQRPNPWHEVRLRAIPMAMLLAGLVLGWYADTWYADYPLLYHIVATTLLVAGAGWGLERVGPHTTLYRAWVGVILTALVGLILFLPDGTKSAGYNFFVLATGIVVATVTVRATRHG